MPACPRQHRAVIHGRLFTFGLGQEGLEIEGPDPEAELAAAALAGKRPPRFAADAHRAISGLRLAFERGAIATDDDLAAVIPVVAEEGRSSMRHEAAAHMNASPAVMWVYARWPDPRVRRLLALNQRATAALLLYLAEDAEPEIARVARYRLRPQRRSKRRERKGTPLPGLWAPALFLAMVSLRGQRSSWRAPVSGSRSPAKGVLLQRFERCDLAWWCRNGPWARSALTANQRRWSDGHG